MFFERSTDRNDCLLRVSDVILLLRRGARSAEVWRQPTQLNRGRRSPALCYATFWFAADIMVMGFVAARSLDGVEQITFKTADYRRQRPFSLSTPVLDNWKAHARIAESSISRGRYLRLHAQALSVYARLSSIPAITPISSSDLRCVIDAISLPVRLRCHARPGGCLPRDGRNQRIDPPSPRH